MKTGECRHGPAGEIGDPVHREIAVERTDADADVLGSRQWVSAMLRERQWS
ncbi:hypothetical protein C791_7201 [Amycolatopsis azurea DSM 43854]|uniref:Uncharacterized protein n=1 Tax=Amycolatopsis azurea DSM 43854 TaxID=1238180 RepID=M2QA43_9PSEU|nr:hypothetical protein C791_7201 [Amycolatopsis azurea DSM 43854]